MSEFQTLRDILGHSPADCRSWERNGNGDGDEVYDEYGNWLNGRLARRPGAIGSVCFLDITLANPDNTKFFGVVLTHGEEQYAAYKGAVTDLNSAHGEGSRTVGSHEVFQKGLPVIRVFEGSVEHIIKPQTRMELSESIEEGEISEDRFLEWVAQDWTEDPLSEIDNTEVREPISLTLRKVLPSHFGHPDDPTAFRRSVERASEKPVEENWNIFTNTHLQGQRDSLTNARGESLSLVWGVPLCIWAEEDSHKRPIPLAQIFIGLGGNPAKIRDHAKYILRTVSMHAFRVNATARAETLGAEKTASRWSHRLPGVLHGIFNSLKIQQSEGKDIFIPPEVFVLKNLASLQQRKRPTWPLYEELYSETKSFKQVIEEIWKDIAKSVGEARVAEDTNPVIRHHYRKVHHKPELQVHLKEEISFSSGDELSALISLCCPLLIEAYHHAYVTTVLEYAKQPHENEVFVKVTLEGDRLCIANPFHKPLNEVKTLLHRGTQKEEIDIIARVTEDIWRVTYPETDDVGMCGGDGNWVVTIERRNGNE